MQLPLLLLGLVSTACGYHILCVQNVPSKSHYHLMKGLVEPLLEAGHKVTWISTHPDTKPVKNLRFIDVSHIQDLTKHMNMTNQQQQGLGVVKQFSWNISRSTLETPRVRRLMEQEAFDAVISEWFFSDVEAGYAAVLGVPWILLSGMVYHTHMEYLVDAVRSVPAIPAVMNDADMPMTLWQRLKNTGAFLYFSYHALLGQSAIEANYEEYYGPIAKARGTTLPPFQQALHNVSILLVNSHPSFAPAQPTPPNVVDIAGYHISDDIPPLPKDLQDLLDSSPQGVVYFSMGSVVRSAALPEHTRKELIQMFAELPYTVLWKFEEKMEGLPKNLHIRPWMPQASILAHPNVKAFITHGGLLSTLEALHAGVPLVAAPVFGDQPANAQRSVRAGLALSVDFHAPGLAARLKEALEEMMTNDSYYLRAKHLSKLFRSRPVSTKRLIQYYIELAIETQGAPHLRSKAQLYSWYQLWMLDQMALLLLVLFLLAKVLKKTFHLLTGSGSSSKGKKQKKI